MILKGFQVLLFSLLILSASYAASLPIAFQPVPGQSYFASQHMTVDSAEFDTISLKIDAQQSGTARLFWANNYDPQFNPPKSMELYLHKGVHAYYLNIAARNPNWIGWATGFIFAPEIPTNRLQIINANLYKGNWPLKIAAGWQEFFIYEEPQLRTVNFIYGPKINGLSVNLYIYLLILLLSIFILLFKFFKSRAIFLSLKMGTTKIIILCLAFWVVLDIRQLIDQGRTITADMHTFYGKSLDEKRAAITLGDYYSFLQFVKTKLPSGSAFLLLHPPYYYYVEKANYYLYPTHYDEKFDYILVYDPSNALTAQVSSYQKSGFKLFAKFKEGEYILKK